jgi:hypothetical protein
LAGDVRVRGACESELEFVRPIAPVNEVRMAIDESGRDPSTFAVDDARVVAPSRWKFVLGTGESNSPLARSYGARFDDANARPSLNERRKARVEPDRLGSVGVAWVKHGAQRLPAADHLSHRPNRLKDKGLAAGEPFP